MYFSSIVFSSEWEDNDGKNDVIKIRKIIYIYIYLFLIKLMVPRFKKGDMENTQIQYQAR